jgi:serine/threonine-protein kinase
MGDAFLAKQEGIGGFRKTVVIKTMHAHLARDPAMVELFMNEARVSAKLNHVNLVHVFDVGQDAEGPYLALEYVDGLTLLNATRRCWGLGQGIPIDVAVRIIALAAQGLAHAHNAGVIHRDISPDNIIAGRDGSVKVLDFGIARTRGEKTASGQVTGKIPYMAPEQPLRGGRTPMPVSDRMDFYGLPCGTLDVRVTGTGSKPSRVKLDIDVLGTPPLRPVSATVGSYVVTLEIGNKKVTASAKITAGGTTTVSLDANKAR